MTETGVEDAVKFFCNHLVAITLLVEEPDGTTKADAYTCFVLEVRGVWVLATAGHVVQRLEDIRASKSLRIIECGLFDGWSIRRSAQAAKVPFNIGDAKLIAIDDPREGIDVGLLSIPPLVRRSLEANGITALSDKTWRNVPSDMDVHFILGLPQELIENVRSGKSVTHLKLEAAVIPVTACEPPPAMVKPTTRFYGKIADQLLDSAGAVLSNIEGMSGGPIIGIRTQNKESRYYLVAIQSSWREDLRVIVGNYASAVAEPLEQEMEAVSKQA